MQPLDSQFPRILHKETRGIIGMLIALQGERERKKSFFFIYFELFRLPGWFWRVEAGPRFIFVEHQFVG